MTFKFTAVSYETIDAMIARMESKTRKNEPRKLRKERDNTANKKKK